MFVHRQPASLYIVACLSGCLLILIHASQDRTSPESNCVSKHPGIDSIGKFVEKIIDLSHVLMNEKLLKRRDKCMMHAQQDSLGNLKALRWLI